MLTQIVPDISLADSLDLSIKNPPVLLSRFHVARTRVVTGSTGRRLGELDYTANVEGHDPHFLAVMSVANGRATVATFRTNESTFAGLRPLVEPFLMTLQARPATDRA